LFLFLLLKKYIYFVQNAVRKEEDIIENLDMSFSTHKSMTKSAVYPQAMKK
jgi:hypothetical protein